MKDRVNTGLLLLRLGVGIVFIMHGWPKISGGPAQWEKIGSSMGDIGIHFLPVFWGFTAAIAEFGGGILLILGVLFRPACIFMLITMVVAMAHHVAQTQDYLHPLLAAVVFIGLIFTGPGKYRMMMKF